MISVELVISRHYELQRLQTPASFIMPLSHASAGYCYAEENIDAAMTCRRFHDEYISPDRVIDTLYDAVISFLLAFLRLSFII